MTADLTFGNRAVTKIVMIVILDDLLVEDSEFFNVTLTTTYPSVTLEPDAATVTIEDVDGTLFCIQTCSVYSGQNKIYRYIFNYFLNIQRLQLDSTTRQPTL